MSFNVQPSYLTISLYLTMMDTLSLPPFNGAAGNICYTLHGDCDMEPSPMVLLGNHHHTGEIMIEHTLKQLTTYYDDISTVTHAPSITIDHSWEVYFQCLDYSILERLDVQFICWLYITSDYHLVVNSNWLPCLMAIDFVLIHNQWHPYISECYHNQMLLTNWVFYLLAHFESRVNSFEET